MNLTAGQIIDGLFRIIQADFCKGAAGVLHLAQDAKGQTLLLKFIKKFGIIKNINAFKNEYQNILKFSHPNVAKAYHFGTHDENFFIAGEYIQGKEFRAAVEDVAKIEPEKIVPLFIQALEGLEAIHNANMLHLDIKSSNIMVTQEGQAKIIDFGLALAFEKPIPLTIRGSLPYMAPEIVLKGSVDHRADLFSIGSLMYFALTGKYPFPKRNQARFEPERLRIFIEQEKPPQKPSRINPKIPAYLDAIALNLLSKNPDERFSTARAVINALKTHHPDDYQESPGAKGSYLIPQHDQLIGREKELQAILESLHIILKESEPLKAIFSIHGERGVGKSALLKKIKKSAEKEAEKISIHYLELPKGSYFSKENWMQTWLAHLYQKLSENKKPILILLDDVEKIPPFLNTLQDQIVQRLKNPKLFEGQKPVLIVLAGQVGLAKSAWVTSIKLSAFSKTDLENYLRSTPALRESKISKEWIDNLFHKTKGNPKEITEHLQQQDSKGLLFDLNGEIRLLQMEDPSLESFTGGNEIPKTTRQRLLLSIEELHPTEREIVEWIAVWSYKNFSTSIGMANLQVLTQKTHILPCLQSLVSKSILEHADQEENYSFQKFSYLGELIYQNLEKEKRSKMHQKIANRTRNDMSLLHQALSPFCTETLKAVLKFTRTILFENGEAKTAKEILERAWKLAQDKPKLSLFLAIPLIEANFYAGDYKTALKIFEHSKSPPKILNLKLIAAVLPILIEKQEFEKAMAMIENHEHSHPFQLILLNFKARIHYKQFLTQPGKKLSLLHKAQEIYEKSSQLEKNFSPLQLPLIRNNDLGDLLLKTGKVSLGVEKLEEKLKRLDKNSNIFIELTTITLLAEAYCRLKDFHSAFDRAKKALDLAQKTKQGKWILYTHHILAGIHQTAGLFLSARKKFGEAQKEFSQALKENRCLLAAGACLEDKKEFRLYTLGAYLRNGQCHQELKQLDQALTYFKAVVDFHPQEIYLGQAYLGLGECYLEMEDEKRAKKYLKLASQLLKKMPPSYAKLSEKPILAALKKIRAEAD